MKNPHVYRLHCLIYPRHLFISGEAVINPKAVDLYVKLSAHASAPNSALFTFGFVVRLLNLTKKSYMKVFM